MENYLRQRKTMGKSKYMFFVILITLIFSNSCKTVPRERELIDVQGMIYDTENRPVVNYRIFIDSKYVAITDIGGRFTLSNVKVGVYKFLGSGDGYLNIEDEIKIIDKTQIIYLRIPAVESKFKEAYESLKNNQLDDARKCITDILKTDEMNNDALYFMSIIEYLSGNTELSRKYLGRIKEKDDEYVQKLKKIIDF